MTLLNHSVSLSRDIFKRYIFKNIAINVRHKIKMVNVRLYKMFSEEQIKQTTFKKNGTNVIKKVLSTFKAILHIFV